MCARCVAEMWWAGRWECLHGSRRTGHTEPIVHQAHGVHLQRGRRWTRCGRLVDASRVTVDPHTVTCRACRAQ